MKTLFILIIASIGLTAFIYALIDHIRVKRRRSSGIDHDYTDQSINVIKKCGGKKKLK